MGGPKVFELRVPNCRIDTAQYTPLEYTRTGQHDWRVPVLEGQHIVENKRGDGDTNNGRQGYNSCTLHLTGRHRLHVTFEGIGEGMPRMMRSVIAHAYPG